MQYKTYVLLDALDSQAPIYHTVGNGQRVQIRKIPLWEPTLRETFHLNGDSHTIRYKEGSKTIDQNKQIKEEKIEANIGWTPTERSDRKFVNGICVTKKQIFMEYLDAHPANEKFDRENGFCDGYPTACFKELDEKADILSENTELKKRVKAAYKVFDISLEEKQAILFRLLGSFYQVSDDPVVCENALINIIDEGDERILDEVLREEMTDDERVSVLIGILLSKNKLSFIKEDNQISILKNGKWINAKEISSDYSMEERKRYLLEFLTSSAGSALLNEMQMIAINDMDRTKMAEKKAEAKVAEKAEVKAKPSKESEK